MYIGVWKQPPERSLSLGREAANLAVSAGEIVGGESPTPCSEGVWGCYLSSTFQ